MIATTLDLKTGAKICISGATGCHMTLKFIEDQGHISVEIFCLCVCVCMRASERVSE
jgi:hypothetical protein